MFLKNAALWLIFGLEYFYGFVKCMVVANMSSCGGLLTAMHGSFNTPNYPSTYPNSLDCTWNITVPSGYDILLNFTQFDIEWTDNCEYDYVQVKTFNRTLGKYCGSRNRNRLRVALPPTDPVRIRNNTVEVYLHTDFSNEGPIRGFIAHYASVDVDECETNNGECSHFCHNFIGGHYCSCMIGYQLHNDGKFCRILCQDVYRHQENGIISSPKFPEDYPPHSSCDWHITAEKGYYVNLEFLSFDVEKHHFSVCPYDYVSVEDENTKLGPYCGNTLPPKFRSSSNWLIVEFFSDKDQGSKGFQARFWLEPIKCPTLVAPAKSVISGPLNFTYKETVLYSCRNGYKLTGSKSRTCQVDGTWTGVEPTCTFIQCDEWNRPEEIKKISFAKYPPTPYGNGSQIIISCNWNRDMYGDQHITCDESSSWRHKPTECAFTCGRAPQSSRNRKNHALEKCTNGRHRSNAIIESQPWLVAIKQNGKLICSGVIISNEWVLTATHCIVGTNERSGMEGTLEVIAGTHHWDMEESGTQKFKVIEVIVHRKFDYAMYSDITILKLSRKMDFEGAKIQPICLAHERSHKHLFRGDKYAVSVGWYSEGPTYMTDRCLRIEKNKDNCKAYINDTHSRIYREKYSSIREISPSDQMICLETTVGTNDNCQILPGSALVAYDSSTNKWFLGGLLTWSSLYLNDCKNYMSKYSLYTKLQKYMKWIKHETGVKPKEWDGTSTRERYPEDQWPPGR